MYGIEDDLLKVCAPIGWSFADLVIIINCCHLAVRASKALAFLGGYRMNDVEIGSS